ncbi:hypothetical protein ACQ4PT_055514 [Festuca glaucescens]
MAPLRVVNAERDAGAEQTLFPKSLSSAPRPRGGDGSLPRSLRLQQLEVCPDSSYRLSDYRISWLPTCLAGPCICFQIERKSLLPDRSMSSSAVKPELPLLPVAPLDGESGYLRWKESMLLRLHTLGLAHALRKKRPAGEKQQRARDDALCRGYILATLSDRLLPVYAHYTTARALWRALARTYELDMGDLANAFRYDAGKPLLENLALLQALIAAGKLSDAVMAYYGFPPEVARNLLDKGPNVLMNEIWKISRRQVVSDRMREIDLRIQHTTDGQGSCSSDDSRPLKRARQVE